MRYTIKQLNAMSEKEFAVRILEERRDRLTNFYSPLAEKLRKAILSLENEKVQPVNTWISVEDRLPEHEVEVLVNEVDVGVMTGWYDARDKKFKGEEYNKLEVTHWMPLPEPPKESDK